MHDFTISPSTKGSQIIKRFVKSLHFTSEDDARLFSRLPSITTRAERTLEPRWRQPVTRQRHSSWFECRLCECPVAREIGGNDWADGARDITNPIMNSLSFGLDTLFLFISWYLSLVCVRFVFISVAHVKAERGSMGVLLALVSFRKLPSNDRCLAFRCVFQRQYSTFRVSGIVYWRQRWKFPI